MAGAQPESNFKKKMSVVLGDWIAPLIAFVVVVSILLALVSALFQSVR